VTGGLFIGVSLWLWLASLDAHGNVACVTANFKSLETAVNTPPACTPGCEADLFCTCIDWTEASDVFASFPAPILTAVDVVANFWGVATVAPGAVYAGVLLLVALFLWLALRGDEPGLFSGCVKGWTVVGLLALWFVGALFAVFAALGLAHSISSLMSLYSSNIVEPCSDGAANLQNLVTVATTAHTDLACAVSPLAGFLLLCNEVSSFIVHATQILNDFNAMCSCIDAMPRSAAPMVAPAIAGTVLAMASIVVLWGACGVVNCCSKYVQPGEVYVELAEGRASPSADTPLVALRLE
jgi:hypothetical protein